ncbi:MAG: hypothetical protein ACQCN6_02975 [Candidatus Bathyarchaeia archaeon]|jgi:hypothetical protein
MNSFPNSVPDKIKISFFEYQRREWEKVLETSVSSKNSENHPETQMHWENISNYAQERIEEIDKQLEQLKINAATR